MNTHKIIVALDFNSWGEGAEFAARNLDPSKHIIKLGHKLVYGHRTTLSAGMQRLMYLGFKVFLDTKFFEIPSIVQLTINELATSQCAPWALTIHSQGGGNMIKSAMADSEGINILAVTKLTTEHANDGEIYKLGMRAYNNSADGIICSAKDLHLFKNLDFMKVTPGIRLEDQTIKNDDQVRVDTPYNAIMNGATHIVVGRPLIEAKNPSLILREIEDQVEYAKIDLL